MTPTLHEIALAAAFGLTLGVAHGLEPDHLVQVSAQVLRKGSDALQAFLLGAVFGLGHVLTTALFGLAALTLGWLLPEETAALLDSAAGPLLLLVGIWALVVAIRRARSQSAREAGGPAHRTWRERLAALKDQAVLSALFSLSPAPEAIAIFIVMLPGGRSELTWGLGGWHLGLITLIGFGLGITLVMGLFGLVVQRSLHQASSVSAALSRWVPVGAGVVIVGLGLLLTLPDLGH